MKRKSRNIIVAFLAVGFLAAITFGKAYAYPIEPLVPLIPEVPDFSSEALPVKFSSPYTLQLQGGDVVYVNDVGVFDHPAVSGEKNFASASSKIYFSDVKGDLYAQDYFAIPGYVTEMNDRLLCLSDSLFIAAALRTPFEPLGASFGDIDKAIGAWALGLCKSGSKDGSEMKTAELSLADVRMEGDKVINNAKWADSPYAGGGAPIALTAHDATPVFVKDKFNGVVALFYMPQPEATEVVSYKNPLKPHLAYYKPDDDGELKLSTFISPISSSAFAVNKLVSCKFVADDEKNYLSPFEMLGTDLSGCLPEIYPTDIAAVDFNGDGIDDIVTVNRGSFRNPVEQQKLYSFANVYIGTGLSDPKIAFKYAGQIFIGNEPYQVVPTLDKRAALVSTADGVYKVTYTNGVLASALIIKNKMLYDYRPYQIAEIDNGYKCKAIAVTNAKMTKGKAPAIEFKPTFHYYKGAEKDGVCEYSQIFYYPLTDDVEILKTKPNMVSTLVFAPAISGRSAASLWVGDQRIDNGKVYAYRFQIGDDGLADWFSRTKYNVSSNLTYQDDQNYPSDNKGKCGVKQQRVDKYGNIISVIGCPAVFLDEVISFGEPAISKEVCPNEIACPDAGELECTDIKNEKGEVIGQNCESDIGPCNIIHGEKCIKKTIFPQFGSFGEVTTMINKVPACSCDNYKELDYCSAQLFNETACNVAKTKCNCDNYQANTRLCGAFDASTCPKILPPCTCGMRVIDPNKCDVTPLGTYYPRLGKYENCIESKITCNCINHDRIAGCENFDSSVCVETKLPVCTCETVKGPGPCDPTALGPQDPVTGEYANCVTVIPPPPVDCTCDDYVMRGSACPNPQDFFDTNGNGVADKCETVAGVSGDCVLLVGKNGRPAVGDWAVGTDYDNYVRLLNRRSSEIYCKEVVKRGGVCDPEKNPRDIFVGELGVYSFKCVQPPADNLGVWQISGFPIGPDFYGEDGFRAGQLPEEIDLPDGNKMSRKTYLTNTATRLFAVSGTGAQSSTGKAILATNIATDFLPSIVKAAKRQFVNTSLTPSLSSSNGSFSVSIGKSESEPYMMVKVRPSNDAAAGAFKASMGYVGAEYSPYGTDEQKDLIIEVIGRAGLDVGQFYAPPAQASTVRNLDPNLFLDAFAEALAKQPANIKIPNFSKAMRDANEIYPWDEYMRVSNAVGNNEAAYNIMPLYYVGPTSGGKSGFGCSLIR